MNSDMENNGHNIFDGTHFDPQFAIALKNFIYANPSTNSAVGRGFSSTSPGIADATPVKVPIDSVTFTSVNLTFNSANNRFICVAPGNYSISGAVCYQQTTDQKIYEAIIYKNGSVYSTSFSWAAATNASGGNLTILISDIVNLAVGDYIELFTFHNSGSTETILSQSSWLALAKV